MLTSINSAPLLSESRQAPHRKSESAILWAGMRPRAEEVHRTRGSYPPMSFLADFVEKPPSAAASFYY